MKVFVLNGWAASERAWDLCAFRRDAIFSYRDHLDGATEAAFDAADSALLVGWSMGGSYALKLALRNPGKVRGLVLVAATPRMMRDPATGWAGMSERRLAALEIGLRLTMGGGFFGTPEGKPNPYMSDGEENLSRGIAYLLETDLRRDLESARAAMAAIPAAIFQSERDAIVRSENAAYLASVFPLATVRMVPGTEHALSIFIPGEIDAAVDALVKAAAS